MVYQSQQNLVSKIVNAFSFAYKSQVLKRQNHERITSYRRVDTARTEAARSQQCLAFATNPLQSADYQQDFQEAIYRHLSALANFQGFEPRFLQSVFRFALVALISYILEPFWAG